MATPEFQRLNALFDALADLPPAQRHAHLDAATDISASTRARIARLLDAHDRVGDATLRRIVDAEVFEPQRWIGRRIGPYRVERELGHGGMGNVFMAWREDGAVDQRVAIKIIRAEALDANTLARFRLERQVLALLAHPNIAAMLDLGELDDGSPYVVMEYVEGVPVTAFAQTLDLKRKLALFLTVCDAVAYAHRNMIVHRDIKPGNVLVDAQGHAKLLDFGIAKPLIARLGTIDVENTRTAQQFFSVHSAAPEQLRGDAVTVACDVYGLGALLYELLAGRPPLTFDGLTPAQIERRIFDEEPAPPSSVAPLDRDLDAIVLRCLRKQPDQRYASVEQLVDDIERYLSKRPVSARRGQWLYRAGRFATRHRLALAAAAVIAGVMIVSGLLLWRQYRVAIDERNRAESVTGFILGTIEAADPGKGGGEDVSVRQLVGMLGSRAAEDLADQPRVLARLTEALVSAQLVLGNADNAKQLLDGAHDALDIASGNDPAFAQRLRLLGAQLAAETGDTATAIRLLAEAGTLATTPDEHLRIAVIESRIPVEGDKVESAREKLEAVTARWLDAPGVEAATRWDARAALGDRLFVEARLQEALALYQKNLDEQRAERHAPLQAILRSLNGIAESKYNLADKSGRDAAAQEANELIRRVYGTRSTPYARALQNEAGLLMDNPADFGLGAAKYEEALKILSEILGSHHEYVGRVHFTLASRLEQVPRYLASAEAHYLAGARIADETLPPNAVRRYFLIGVPGVFEARIGKYDEAIRLLEPLVTNATDDLKERDIYGYVHLGLAFARYALHPTVAAVAELDEQLRINDPEDPEEQSAQVREGLEVLRRRIAEVRGENAAKGLPH